MLPSAHHAVAKLENIVYNSPYTKSKSTGFAASQYEQDVVWYPDVECQEGATP